MNSHSKNTIQRSPGFEKIVLGFGFVFVSIGNVMRKCMYSPIIKFKEFWIYSSCTIASLSFLLTYQNDHLRYFYHASNGIMGNRIQDFLESFQPIYQFLFMNTVLWGGLLFCLGLYAQMKRNKYEKLTENVGIRNSSGLHPKLKSIIYHAGGEKTSILFHANGVGLGDFTSKHSNIALMLGEKVEKILEDHKQSHIEVLINNGEFPKIFCFYSAKKYLKEPFSFVVGKCLNKVHTQCIRKLPHLLVAGTTSNGKSNFLKNVMLGLLESSERIQLKVIDLKKGVEMSKFSCLNNIEVAKNINQANKMLEELTTEMEKRYDLMHERGVTEISSVVPTKDILVLIVDEASVLYDKTGLSGSKKETVERARNYTDELTKLARAAGIHVIIATQKVVKETVDSRVQANMGGWMCFKVANDIASRLVLESSLAAKLPKVAGRGIWKTGNTLKEIQAPYVSEACLEEQLALLCKKFNSIYPKLKEGRDDN